MTRYSALVCACALGLFLFTAPAPARAQTPLPAPLNRPLRVFIDCRGPGCDQEFFRNELFWFDHVRDQRDADIHLLITHQGTGGGGSEYTLRAIGQGRWAGREDVLHVYAEAGETDDVRRRLLAQTFGLLLARYAAETPVGADLRLTAPPRDAGAPPPAAEEDPWNLWVFRININSFLNGQQGDRNSNVNVNTSANHTSENWKILVNAGFNYSESRFELSDGTFYSYRRGRNFNTLVVKSLGDHWSAGAMLRLSRSTFNNQRLNLRLAPGIEYNFFPYRESTERQLTIQWTTGPNRFEYDQETIYGLLAETRWDQQMLASLGLRQPFGSVRLTAEFANYFHDLERNRMSINADIDVRLFRGFSFNVNGDYSVIHDQLSLPRAGATDEEIIARQRQLQSSYRYFLSVGVTYRFGSINNNIVNQRFGGGF